MAPSSSRTRGGGAVWIESVGCEVGNLKLIYLSHTGLVKVRETRNEVERLFQLIVATQE